MRIPGYQELSPVARGGFASVFRARQVAFDREVAVKVLTVELGDGRDRRRFERECLLMGRLTGHPAIVTILDSGFTEDGMPYLTTPFYHAGSLVDQLQRTGPFTVAETLRVGVAVAGALELAHRNGILHRDVKPANILVSAYGEPALTDFGIAALVQANGTTATQLTQAFTVDHAPPEVLEGEKATVGSDVYSLGSTLWMLLAGRAPFAGGDPGILPRALKVRLDPLPPLERSDVPPSLEAALAKAMAKQPDERFDTAAAFGEALQRVQREIGEPVTPLRADAPMRTAPPGPAVGDDLAETEALPAAAFAARAADVGAAAAPAARSVAAPAEPAPRWRGAESGWYRSDAEPPAEPAFAAPAPPPAAPPPTDWTRAPRPDPHPHDRYGAGTDDVAVLPAPVPATRLDAPVAPSDPGSDLRSPQGAGPERRNRRTWIVAVAIVLAAALLAWLLLRGRNDTVITTPNPAETSTTAEPSTTVATTAAPTSAAPTTAKRVPSTAPASSAAPTTAATTAPAPPPAANGGSAVVPADASGEVRAAADVAQRAGDALANADWTAVRSLIPSLAGTGDAALDQGWGRLDEVTMVVTDAKERRGQVTLRVGEVAHERNGDDSRRTNLYCATWTVEGGRVVNMADQQNIAPSPWRDGWADPATAVDVLRAQCRKL